MRKNISLYAIIHWCYAIAMTIMVGVLLWVAQSQRSEISYLNSLSRLQPGKRVPELTSVVTLDGPLVIDRGGVIRRSVLGRLEYEDLAQSL